MLKFAPAVFAVERDYLICARVNEPCVMWVEVGDECYYDQSNGILRSATSLHKMKLPQKSLDTARKYTVCYRRIIERKPYFSELEDITRVEFSFYPVEGEAPRGYHIADAHGRVAPAVRAARVYEERMGKMDFLILNGDVIDHSGKIENFDAIYEISSELTHGEKPIIFSRGNHDTRGIYAEKIADYTPTRGEFSYFTFRLGGIWGIVLDCGEDKPDENAEYGHTICCHDFRRRETEYLEKVCKNAKEEFLALDVTRRIVVCHVPFTRRYESPFNIEEETYKYWTKLISEHIKPDAMICGHLHKIQKYEPGCLEDAFGQGFTVSVTSLLDYKNPYHAGAGYTFAEDGITVTVADSDGAIKVGKI